MTADDLGGPFWTLVGVTVRAGFRDTQFCGQIRPRDPEAVIATVIYHHEGFVGHVAGDAFGTRRVGRVHMMVRCVVAAAASFGEFLWRCALVAEGAGFIARSFQSAAVRLVAVSAGDTGQMHAALQE